MTVTTFLSLLISITTAVMLFNFAGLLVGSASVLAYFMSVLFGCSAVSLIFKGSSPKK